MKNDIKTEALGVTIKGSIIKTTTSSFLAAAMVAGIALPSAADTVTGGQSAVVQNVSIAKTNKMKPAKELMKMIKRPTSPKDILKNLKFAIENELLMQDDFYTDENLKKLFGGNRVVWRRKYGEVELYDFKGVFQNADKFHGEELVVRKNKQNSKGKIDDKGKLLIHVGVPSFDDGRFNINLIENIFGKSRTVESLHKEGGPYKLLSPATHPLGNTIVTYTINTKSSSTLFHFILYSGGGVRLLNCNQGEK